MKKNKPFGLWPSPIDAQMVARQAGFSDVRWGSADDLLWVETHSGQSVLKLLSGSDANREVSDSLTPRGKVGYGGGEFDALGEQVVVADKSGILYAIQLPHGRPHPITPAFGSAAAPAISPDSRWVAYVWSDGQDDFVGLVDIQGLDWPHKLVRGADFYSQLAWHPSGQWLAWVEWDHPNMPWDGSRVMLGRLAGSSPRLVEKIQVGGGQDAAASQPVFSPDGKWLAFVEESGEWETLFLHDLASGARHSLLQGDGTSLMPPLWVQGLHSLAWSPASDALYALRHAAGSDRLWRVGLDRRAEALDSGPYTVLSQLSVHPQRDEIALLASGPQTPQRVVVYRGGNWNTIARSSSEMLDPDTISMPEHFEWPASDGTVVHGLYYPPRNAGFTAQGVPPAIVYIHGGPTSETVTTFKAGTQYFTSRGYAWLEVNYRGSTGYGRTYRNLLRRRWGDYDVEDAVTGARALAAAGLADEKRLIIRGGSAGGYTVYNALIRHPGVFKAGLCQYGVSNLFALDLDTHKFEAHYTASLVGTLPEAAPRYHAWSPVFHANQIRDPIYIFQGADDRVVPPSQSEEIVAALRASRVFHQYKVYPGEGHGFRLAETIADYLKESERFLMTQVLFAP